LAVRRPQDAINLYGQSLKADPNHSIAVIARMGYGHSTTHDDNATTWRDLQDDLRFDQVHLPASGNLPQSAAVCGIVDGRESESVFTRRRQISARI
jgi:hypothetical protein